jgi:uncharacterized membrane protein YbhN (UPF0104 family)
VRRSLSTVLTVALGIAILALVLRRVGLDRTWSVLVAADWIWAAVGVIALAIPMTLLKAYRWHLLLKAMGADWPYACSLWASLVGNCGAFFTAGQIGDFYRAYLVREANFSLTTAVWSVVWDRLLDVWSLTCLSCVVALLTPTRDRYVWVLTLSLCAVGCTIALLLVHRLRPVVETLGRLNELLHRVVVGIFRKEAIPPLETWGWSLLAQLLLAIRLGTFALAVGIRTGVNECTFFGLVANLVAYIPLSINGLGTREASLVALFERNGYDGRQALAFSVLIVASWAVNAVLGYIAWVWRARWLPRQVPSRGSARNTVPVPRQL